MKLTEVEGGRVGIGTCTGSVVLITNISTVKISELLPRLGYFLHCERMFGTT